MKLKVFSLAALVLLTGCDKVKSIMGGSANCDSDAAKEAVVQSFSKHVSDMAAARVKDLIDSENVTVDMGKLRAALKQITFNVTDVRTNNTDGNSKTHYCATNFVVNVPSQMVNEANAARAVYNENNVSQAAVLADISFENNQLKKELEYSVQPTDDGKKVLTKIENPDALAYFVRDVAVDSLLKAVRQNAAELAKQEALRIEAEQNAAAEEYQSLLVSEAQEALDTANEMLNLVWNSTTAEIRERLLAEQRIWLKKRELECKLESAELDNPELGRLNCETNMTNNRTRELRQKIYYLEP